MNYEVEERTVEWSWDQEHGLRLNPQLGELNAATARDLLDALIEAAEHETEPAALADYQRMAEQLSEQLNLYGRTI